MLQSKLNQFTRALYLYHDSGPDRIFYTRIGLLSEPNASYIRPDANLYGILASTIG
jgi:hypothetical protein